jgi:hypothetical protein
MGRRLCRWCGSCRWGVDEVDMNWKSSNVLISSLETLTLESDHCLCIEHSFPHSNHQKDANLLISSLQTLKLHSLETLQCAHFLTHNLQLCSFPRSKPFNLLISSLKTFKSDHFPHHPSNLIIVSASNTRFLTQTIKKDSNLLIA